jgi:hypothetical protein
MANTIKIKRRPSSGEAGKPSSLYNGELAFNEKDNILYYGYASGVGGVASTIEQIGGSGYFTLLSGANATGVWPVSVTGNAGTVTNGVYTTGSYSDPTWLTISKSKVGLSNVTNDAQVKKSASSTDGYIPTWSGNSGDALGTGYSVETTLSGSSSSLPRADAVKTYIDNLLGANDAMIFKGTIGTGGTITSLPTTYSAGWTYRVITAGTYAGVVCEVGDLIIAVIDRSGTGNLNSDWTVAQTNIDGAVLTTRTLTAGNGLTGGGDLSTDRTFDVGAGDGITVNANDVAVNSTGVQDITGAKNFSGNIISSGTLSLRMATTASTATQFPVFVADPSSSAQNVLTRTPSQVKTDIGLSNVENTALSTWAGSTNITTLGTVATGVWSATTIAVNKGGTGQTSYTNGQLLIGNSTGNTLTKSTLTEGTGIDITNSTGSITITHEDTSTLAGAQGGNGIAAFTVDGLGHVTAVTTATYLTAGTVCAAIADCTLDGGSF